MPDVMTDLHLCEQRVFSRQVFEGNFLQVYQDVARLPDGALASREFIVHPGAVMVIPLLENQNRPLSVVLERQYRYPVQQVMIEFPAGKLDAGELPQACAQRELWEETGYRASAWARAGVVHPAIAYSTESIEIWFARDLTAGASQLDSGEHLDVFTTTVDDFFGLCQQGLVTDVKTLAGAFWLQNYRAGAIELSWRAAV